MKALLKRRRLCWWLAAALAVGPVLGWWLVFRPGRLRATVLREETIDVRGVPRHYRLVVPDSLDGHPSAPVLFAFHGAGDTPEQMAEYTQLDRLAASKRFCLVYLQGRHLSWPPMIPPDNPEYFERDLAFFDALCDQLRERYPVDEKRFYAAGLSQGAGFVTLLVAKRSDRLAAAVSHSGWLADPLSQEGIHAERKCPMMFIVGSEDQQVPPSVVENACACFRGEGHPTEFSLIEGVGHKWALKQGINERIWRFLSRYALP